MKPSLSIETMFTASAVAFDAVALYNNGTIIIRNNDEVLHELGVVCEHLSISPNSKYVAYGEGDSVTVHELSTNTTTAHTAEWPYKVHDNGALLHSAQSLIELPKHYTFTPKGFVIANDRQLQLDQEIVDVDHTVVGTFRNFYVSASGLLLTYSGVEIQNTRMTITHTFDFGRYVGLLSGTQLYLVDDKAKNFRIDVTSEINAPLLKKYILPIDTGPNGEGSYHIDGKGVGTPTQIGDFFIHQDAVAKKLYVGGPRIKKNKITERFTDSQFLGELPASEFISAASLMQEIGVSWTRNTEASWLKFYDKVDGKIKYIARRPITNSISWNLLNNAGIVYGKEITIQGNRYIVRLIKGASSDPFDTSASNYDPAGSHGSEWNRLMYHVSVGSGNNYTSEPTAPGDWAQYSDAALGNSYYTICQERNGNLTLLRGNNSSVSYYTWTNIYGSYAWRPLLELVGSEMPSQFLGEVDASDFISGSDLATALGVTEGIDSSSGKWLRYYDGDVHKIKLIAKQPIREQISWSHLNSKNAVAGTPIVIDGMSFTVRLPKGANSNPSDAAAGYDHENAYGSEWNHLMYRVAAGNENDIFDSESLQRQARFTDIDLGITGQFSLCQEVAISEDAVDQIVVRGSQGVSYLSHAGREELLSWRPVLEIGADDYHDIHSVRKFVEQFETINGVPTDSWTPYKNSLMYTDVEATGFVEFDAEPEYDFWGDDVAETVATTNVTDTYSPLHTLHQPSSEVFDHIVILVETSQFNYLPIVFLRIFADGSVVREGGTTQVVNGSSSYYRLIQNKVRDAYIGRKSGTSMVGLLKGRASGWSTVWPNNTTGGTVVLSIELNRGVAAIFANGSMLTSNPANAVGALVPTDTGGILPIVLAGTDLSWKPGTSFGYDKQSRKLYTGDGVFQLNSNETQMTRISSEVFPNRNWMGINNLHLNFNNSTGLLRAYIHHNGNPVSVFEEVDETLIGFGSIMQFSRNWLMGGRNSSTNTFAYTKLDSPPELFDEQSALAYIKHIRRRIRTCKHVYVAESNFTHYGAFIGDDILPVLSSASGTQKFTLFKLK